MPWWMNIILGIFIGIVIGGMKIGKITITEHLQRIMTKKKKEANPRSKQK